MSVDIVFICDRCGCADHIEGDQPSRLLSLYTPPGWLASNSGFNTRYVWHCEVCARPSAGGTETAGDTE